MLIPSSLDVHIPDGVKIFREVGAVVVMVDCRMNTRRDHRASLAIDS